MRIVLQAFQPRRFFSSLLALTFVGAAGSGAALYFRPEGSIARWVGWSALGLDKRQWEAVHIGFVLVFLLTAVVHVWYNWRPLAAYLGIRSSAHRQSGGGRMVLPAEFAAAAVLLGLVAYAVLGSLPPFSSMLQIRSDIKDGRLAAVTPPPVADADRLTLAELCRQLATPEHEAIRNAHRRGITIRDSSLTIAAIAQQHRLSPEEVYEALRGIPAERAHP